MGVLPLTPALSLRERAGVRGKNVLLPRLFFNRG